MLDLSGRSVTIVGMNFAPETTGNAPYTTALALALQSAGAQVHVITGIPHYPAWRVEDSKYRTGKSWIEEFHGFRVTRCRHVVPSTPNLKGRALMESSFLRRALPRIRSDRSEALIAVTPALSALGATLLGRRGRPVGVLVQDLTGTAAQQSGITGGRVGSIIAAREYAMIKSADRVGIIAPRFGEVLAAGGLPLEKLVDLPNFTHVTPVVATTAEARARLGWAINRFTVVHTGNIGHKQGLENVVEAARESGLRGLDVDFVLVGDGNQRARLQKQAIGLDNLKFRDPLDSDLYPYALAAADVLLLNELPGVRDMSLPSKLTSYSVAGRPILAAVEPGGISHELLSDGYARLVIPGDPSALVDAVQQLAASPEERERLAARALNLNETHYGRPAAENRYAQFAGTLLSLGQRSRSG